MNALTILHIKTPTADTSEVIRYMGSRGTGEQLNALAAEGVRRVSAVCDCRACYIKLPLEVSDGGVKLGDTYFTSRDLAKNLCGCSYAYLFCATLGHAVDRAISAAGVSSPSVALAMDAAATEICEKLCDFLCNGFAEKECATLKPRFSAGYGDLDIQYQITISKLLNTSKLLGAAPGNGCMYSPTKTVTAFAGVPTQGVK